MSRWTIVVIPPTTGAGLLPVEVGSYRWRRWALLGMWQHRRTATRRWARGGAAFIPHMEVRRAGWLERRTPGTR